MGEHISIVESFGSGRATPSLPGSAVEPYPQTWERRGSMGQCAAWMAPVPGGSLRVLVAREPAGKLGRLIWHLSISFVDNNEKPTRCPTWDEMKAARYTFVPGEVAMELLFPATTEPYLDDFPTCLHLWEVE